MFGLIRQLKKLITFVINLPKVLTLLPKIVNPSNLVTTLAIGMFGSKLAEMRDTAEESITDATEGINELAQERIDSINESNIPEAEKQQLISEINTERQQQIQDVTSGIQDGLKEQIDLKLEDAKKAIEPSIMSALAPFTLMLGVPIALTRMLGIISDASEYSSLLSEVGSANTVGSPTINETATSPEDAEAGFESDIASAEASSTEGTGDSDLTVLFNEEVTGHPYGLTVSREQSDALVFDTSIDSPFVFRIDDLFTEESTSGIQLQDLITQGKWYAFDDYNDEPDRILFGINRMQGLSLAYRGTVTGTVVLKVVSGTDVDAFPEPPNTTVEIPITITL